MSSIPKQLATFAAVLAVLYAAGFTAGQFVDTSHGDDESMGAGHGMEVQAVRGLAVAQDGLRLDLRTPELRRGETAPLRFAITGAKGAVTDFDVAHEKRMHLIVVRRDLTGFQHLHPRMASDGTWSAPVRLRDPGSYRVLADFTRDGKPHTLAADLRVDGDASLRPLPAPATVARTGGYTVELDAGAARAGHESALAFSVTRAGAPVETEPYLGAGGHLVVLREGDLAFLHVHPLERTRLRFETTLPSDGRYRLFLQFKVDGRVHTAAFTRVASR
jgi:hypothetical protein